MSPLPRLILTRHLAEAGASTRLLAAAVKAGSLVRNRQGVYVEASAWAELAAWQRHRLRIEAVAETAILPVTFSLHSAASVWGIPTIQRGQPIHALTLFRGGGRSRAGVRKHLVEPGTVDAEIVDGLSVTSRQTHGARYCGNRPVCRGCGSSGPRVEAGLVPGPSGADKGWTSRCHGWAVFRCR